jgi:hypothetical protein
VLFDIGGCEWSGRASVQTGSGAEMMDISEHFVDRNFPSLLLKGQSFLLPYLNSDSIHSLQQSIATSSDAPSLMKSLILARKIASMISTNSL